jgi:hypothetical protein
MDRPRVLQQLALRESGRRPQQDLGYQNERRFLLRRLPVSRKSANRNQHTARVRRLIPLSGNNRLHLPINDLMTSTNNLNRPLRRRGPALTLLIAAAMLASGLPALADNTVWLACDGETTMVHDMKTVPYHGRQYGFSESSQSVISGGVTRAAEFNAVAVVWDEDMNQGLRAHFSINRSTLSLDAEYTQDGKTVALGSGTCRKTQPPANNQF